MIKTNSEIKVSIVMCTYNGEKFIREQLDSIVNQTYPIYELLIFDDASSDNTIQVIEEYASKYSFIKLTVNEKNIGVTKNFEKALLTASGDVVSISDQDDIWITTKIEKMIKVWRSESPLTYCDSLIFKTELPQDPKSNSKLYRRFEGEDGRKLFFINTVSGHAMIIRKEFIPLIIPFPEGIYYDWWTAVVAAYNGGVQYYPETLVLHRAHGNNATVDKQKNLSEDEKKTYLKKHIIKHLEAFKIAPGILSKHREFAEKLSKFLIKSMESNFYKPLFLFIIKHRLLLFNSKKRKISFFTHIKHSYRRTL